jgi:hypothetical protein
MSKRRLTYWGADGKRHWTERFDPPITLDLSESAKFGPADKFYGCRRPHTKHRGPRAGTKSGTRLPKEPCQLK